MLTWIMFIIAFLSISAFVLLFIKCGYCNRLLAKYGLTDHKPRFNWTAFSWQSCLANLECKADVVFFGDSITRGGSFQKCFSDIRVVNLGATGDTPLDMLNRVPAVATVSPKKVFILGGINGLTDFNVSRYISHYERLLIAMQEALPDAQLYIQSVLPISYTKQREMGCKNKTIVRFNNALEALAKKYAHTYIDLHRIYQLDGEMNPEFTKEGIHLKPEAYFLWEQEIKQYIM